MRAKEYINLHKQELKHADIVSQVIKDLLPLRMDKDATDEYMNNRLSADTRYKQYLLQNELFERGNAMQTTEPTFEKIEGELPMDIAPEVREELFKVIREDGSFGYLFYILGTEQNSRHNSEPMDCIPNGERIVQCITENRDDYPKEELDGYINDDLNYQQYNILMDGHYWDEYDALYLAYFNRVYAVYDELRLRKQSISGVRNYLREQQFETDAEKYWTFAYIVTLIDESDEYDTSLRRCRQELMRIIEPMKSTIVNEPESNGKKLSHVHLNKKKGNKLDIIRVFNALYELGKFVDENGDKLTKKDYFIAVGEFMNMDLEHYDKDLSNSMSSSVAYEKQTRIYDEMKEKHQEIYNSK